MTTYDLMRRNENAVQRLFRDFWGDGLYNEGYGEGNYGITVDIKEQDKSYILEAELPGYRKEEVKVDLDDNVLTITAEHSSKKEEKGSAYIRRERVYGTCKRSFVVDGIDRSGIEAAFENGVLVLTLPKEQEVPVLKRSVEIK